MKRLIPLFILVCFFSLSTTAYAKDYSDSIKTIDISQLSNEDMTETLDSLIQKISKDLGIVHIPHASCYEYDWSVLAHNTLIPIGDVGSTICVNLLPFKSCENANYFLVHTIAHEVRHTYQYEHQFDDSDYGRACYNGLHNYNSWYEDIDAYYSQWLEQDANEYADSYTEKYFNLVR